MLQPVPMIPNKSPFICLAAWLNVWTKYAKDNGNTVTGVVIEALDTFLRGRKVD